MSRDACGVTVSRTGDMWSPVGHFSRRDKTHRRVEPTVVTSATRVEKPHPVGASPIEIEVEQVASQVIDAGVMAGAASAAWFPVAACTSRQTVELEIVVPAYNEERRLPATLRRAVDYLALQPYSSAVVVVDNASTDRTADVVRSFESERVPVRLLRCTRPGKGSAVRTGIMTSSSTFVGFMDADLATPMETLDVVMPLLQSGESVVIGSRHVRDAVLTVTQSGLRRAGGSLFRTAARGLLPAVADTQCGFKFFRGDAVRDVIAGCQIDGFSFDVELLARLDHAHHRIVEVPVSWTDVPGSTFDPVRHGLQSFIDAWRMRRLLARDGVGAGRDTRARTDLFADWVIPTPRHATPAF